MSQCLEKDPAQRPSVKVRGLRAGFILGRFFCAERHQVLLQHKLVRGAKKTSILKQLISRYDKYAEVVPDSDSEERRTNPAGSEVTRRAWRLLVRSERPCVQEDESVVARRGMDDEDNNSGDEAWDYSATVRPSEAAAASAPAPKVAAVSKTRKKKKKKQPDDPEAAPAAATAAAPATPGASGAAASAGSAETAGGAPSLASSASDVELGKVRLSFVVDLVGC